MCHGTYLACMLILMIHSYCRIVQKQILQTIKEYYAQDNNVESYDYFNK